MQYLEGTQLNKLQRLPSPEELRKWARQLISALYTCHALAKVCHRDIKPENLKVSGAYNDLVLFDFGASECFTEEDDIVTTTAGSFSFFAPEQLKTSENLDGPKIVHARKTDIWAAGVTLF
jgi:serine/threonine protein kinase